MGYKVLIVDDEPLIVKNLTHIIDWNSLDCEIIGTAQNGQEALEILDNERIDILLTDISMPGTNGIDLLKQVQNMTYKPIAILISGYDEFEYAREGLKYNALDYILKPIDYEELQECIIRGIEKLKSQVKSEYEHEKHVIYEIITGGKIDSKEINKSRPYLAINLKTQEQNIDLIIQKTQDLLLKMDKQPFLYKMSEQEVMVVIEFSNQSIDQVKTSGDIIARQINKEVSQQCVMAIGRPVNCLYDIKISVDHARELLKFDSFIKDTVITEERVKEKYKPKHTATDLMTEAIVYIEKHFQEDLGIEQVAEQVGLSVSYFSLLFKQKTGVTFLDFLTSLRVKYACLFLENSDLKTYDIAQKVGYTDQRYFSQVFKKKMKRTPSEYRKEFR